MSTTATLRTSPAKTNDLFARIADTTPGAIKTREGLFGELKAELELHARLEQDLLLPVLRKNAKTKDLATSVSDRLRDMRTLLGRLDKAPKDGDDFPASVAELKKLFQAHLRDEKNELLPAIQKALSDDEAAAVAEKMAAAKAAAEKAEQEAADKRRADARAERERAEERQATADAAERAAKKVKADAARVKREQAEARQAAADAAERAAKKVKAEAARLQREQAEARQAAADAAERVAKKAKADAARAAREQAEARRATVAAAARAEKAAAAEAALAVKVAAEASQAQVDAAQQVMETGIQAASDVTRQAATRFNETVRIFGDQTRAFGVTAKTGEALAQGFKGASREWMSWAQTRTQNQVAGFAALMQCRTPQDLIALQTRLVREDMELAVKTGGRVYALATASATDAAANVTR